MTPALLNGCVIALLGAESTGKTALARVLAERLVRRGIRATAVPEYLREWCDGAGRTPRPEEQAAIAAEQTRRIAAAAARGVAVADTTALMTAVYSDLLFDDQSLYPTALAVQRGYAVTLLTGLDLPWVPDGLQRDGPQVRAPVDARVRVALDGAGIDYAVVHGQGSERLASAWNAINLIAQSRDEMGDNSSFASKPGGPWRWACDKCSDPGCEHQLFSELLRQHQ